MPQSYAVRPATARDELYGRIGKQVLYLFEYLASMPDALSTIPNRQCHENRRSEQEGR